MDDRTRAASAFWHQVAWAVDHPLDVVAGAALCWVLWRWLREMFDE